MVRIGTRGSDLALWQARHISARIEANSGEKPELVVIETAGDRIQDVPLGPELGRSFFTKDIEQALLDGHCDLAVHSLKDLAVQMPDGLCLASVPPRVDAGETLVYRAQAADPGQAFVSIAPGSVVGTSSPRRAKFLNTRRPDLEVRDLRGNVPTRVKKLARGDYDAIFLASAGVERLELDFGDLLSMKLPATSFPGAPGQGALGLEAREGDAATLALLAELQDEATARTTSIERRLLAGLGGGCSLPLGAYCEIVAGGRARLTAFLFHPDHDERVEVVCEDDSDDAVVASALRALEPVLARPLLSRSFVVLGGATPPRLANDLRAAGGRVEHVACYDVALRVLGAAEVATIRSSDAVLLASKSALVVLHESVPDLDARTTLVVPGSATAAATRDLFPGHEVVVADPPRGEGLGRIAVDRAFDQPTLLGAEDGNRDALTVCEAAGKELRIIEAYGVDPRLDVDSRLETLDCDAIPIYMSPTAARICGPHLRGSSCIAIGPTTAEALSHLGVDTRQPKTPDHVGILDLEHDHAP